MIFFYSVLFIFATEAFAFQTITFPSKDSLEITADLYISHPDSAPFIVLFHQAGFSRGEYREIAPGLNSLGFNCMAIDQRSGDKVNGIINETFRRATAMGNGTTYLDALPDMLAAIEYAKKHYARGKLLLWGSSYSAALVLKIAGDYPRIADGILAFAPGEYFIRLGKPGTFITKSARHITIPVFITSAKKEKERWFSIYQAILSSQKRYFLPEGKGIHGSRALWKSTPESNDYWQAVKEFLKQFQ